ncbi:hypothetical protein NP493_1028g00042 [Ridgeia piscesae]|uniref:Uncharacterized protein n=1 Tax=Ridgeia piscesae TaxID=27915 RepID=A0AAD9NKD4_RIDPI|nr:hypothetical protein NP493_1028g00042 [Ridgeia piscesae]
MNEVMGSPSIGTVLAAELPLYEQLQQSYKIIKKQHKNWHDTLSAAHKAVMCLQNVVEQYHCCAQVSIEDTPFRPFVGIQEALLGKLIQTVEAEMLQIREALHELGKTSSAVMKQVNYCLQSYNKNLTGSSVAAMTVCQPLRPSIAVLLEKITDAGHLFHTQYMCKKYYIENVAYNDVATAECLANNWLDTKTLDKQITGKSMA